MSRLPRKKQIDNTDCRQNDSASKKAAVPPDRSKRSAADAMTFKSLGHADTRRASGLRQPLLVV